MPPPPARKSAGPPPAAKAASGPPARPRPAAAAPGAPTKPEKDHGGTIHVLKLLEKGKTVTTQCGIVGTSRRPVWLNGKPGDSSLWEGVSWTVWPSVATCATCLRISPQPPRGYIPADELTDA